MNESGGVGTNSFPRNGPDTNKHDVRPGLNRDFHFDRPGSAREHTEALRVGQICSSPILQAPETVSGVHIEVELTGWV